MSFNESKIMDKTTNKTTNLSTTALTTSLIHEYPPNTSMDGCKGGFIWNCSKENLIKK